MRVVLLLKNIAEGFSGTRAFNNECTWNPPQRHSALEMFLSQIEADTTGYNPTRGMVSYGETCGRSQYYDKAKRQWFLCGYP